MSSTEDPHQPSAPEALAVADPRGLIAEAYRMDGLSPEDCRAIFFDWALGRTPQEGDPAAAARLHAHYGAAAPDHPMTAVLAQNAAPPRADRPRRRGRRG